MVKEQFYQEPLFPVTMRVRGNYLSKFKFNFSKKSRNCQKISLTSGNLAVIMSSDMRVTITILTSLMLVMGAMANEPDAVTALRPAIREAAAEHGVDPVMMEAIIRHESAHATSKAARKKNNLAGIMGRGGQRRYETKEECVQDLARILGKHKAKGRVSVTQVARVYCESRSEWTRCVSANIRDIRKGRWGAEHIDDAPTEAKQ